MRRIFAATAVAILGLMLLAVPAQAQYEEGDATLIMGDTTLRPGDSTTVTGDNCPPGSTVTFTMVSGDGTRTPLGTTTADSEGDYNSRVTIPSGTRPGRYTLEARCGDEVASVQFTVTAAAAANPRGAAGTATARTGTDAMTWTAVGAALVAGGAGIMALARRRRATGTTA